MSFCLAVEGCYNLKPLLFYDLFPFPYPYSLCLFIHFDIDYTRLAIRCHLYIISSMEFDFGIFNLYNQNKSIDRKKKLNSILENTGQSVMGIMVII